MIKDPLGIGRDSRKHGKSGPSGKSGKGGRHYSKFERARFISWDGEGVTLDSGEHIYVLFRNNDASIINHEGLSTLQVLDFIGEHADHLAINVGFGTGYDVNMIVRDLDAITLKRLANGETVDFGRYRLQHEPRKRFQIWVRHRNRSDDFRLNEKGTWVFRAEKYIEIWDVFGFFQCKFTKALTTFFVDLAPDSPEAAQWRERIAFIESGKNLRGFFTNDMIESFVDPYCKAEVDALTSLMERFHSYLHQLDIQLTRWDGAGALATALMLKYDVKEHIGELEIPDLIRAGEFAYFGGRIENFGYGHYDGPVYHDDICSAYPDALRRIRSMRGDWNHVTDDGDWINPFDLISHSGDMTLVLISWKLPMRGSDGRFNPIGPFPWRTSKGNVLFPYVGKGWVWLPELQAAIETMTRFDLTVYVHEYWEFKSSEPDVRPFAFIEDIYEVRRRLKAESNGAEKPLKVGVNSIYGKTAQSVGYNRKTFDGRVKKPPFHNILIAGWVTSYVRAKLLRAAMQAPHSIICIATDGIYSVRKLNLPRSSDLGDWEYIEHDWITLVMSGVYWYSTRGKVKSYFRGFLPDTLSREAVLEGWKTGQPSVKCRSRYFMGMKTCIARGKMDEWRKWLEFDRELALSMKGVVKRKDIVPDSQRHPESGLVPTIPVLHPVVGELIHEPEWFPFADPSPAMSTKYRFDWDDMIDKTLRLTTHQMEDLMRDTTDEMSGREEE